MAIIWDIKITVLDVDKKCASIAATRTDGDDIRMFVVLEAIIATAQQKLDVIDNIRSQFEADKIRREKVAAIMGVLETQAKAALEAKEIT